ncbi:MAG TPA: hypothetical protein VMU15_14245 [Anaeromyxobacter sp.]|nr:hypothetical protein [Anaeromyxobacter sp.]
MRMTIRAGAALALGLALCACGGEARGGGPTPVAPGGGESCGPVRLTSYEAGASGWCEIDRTLPVLPASVRAGLTLAIAEPWDGGSYGGDPGEACGECWEVATLSEVRTVMVTDLCPIEGNPLCAGGFFHFDLAAEAAAALGMSGLEAASTRRVPCPVSGDAYLELLDRNEWGYLRFAVINHRIPVRQVEYRAVGDTAWKPAARSGGAWAIADDGSTFASGGPGGVFRITSAQGEAREMPNALGYGVAKGSTFDLGAQLTDQAPPAGPSCTFEPPADVYLDGFGGIPEVRWTMDPWSSAVGASEVTDGCLAGSCLRVTGMSPWNGFNLYYVQPFAPSIFSTLSLEVKAASGGGAVDVWAGGCAHVAAPVTGAWSAVTVDLAASCAGVSSTQTVQVQATAGSGMTLLLDEVRFQK